MKTIVHLCLAAVMGMVAPSFATTNSPSTVSNRLDLIVIPLIDMREARGENVLDGLIACALSPPEAVPTESIGLIRTTRVQQTTLGYLDHSLPIWTNLPALTLSLRRVTLGNALKYTTELLGLNYMVTDTNIIIRTTDGEILNRK